MQKNKLAMCKRIFKDFQAKKIVDDEKILIIDWKNKDGSGEYAIRYTLDMEKGNFIITGDVGYCIASWHNHLTPDNLSKFLDNIGYFKEKIECWSEKYTYRYKDIKADLNMLKDDLLADTDFTEEEIDKDFEEILSMADYIEAGMIAHPDLVEIYEKYYSDWYDSDFGTLGRRISDRIYLWVAGFQMAWQQLSKNTKKYYEISFTRHDNPEDEYSICIIGVKQPTRKEAEDFCKKDMIEFGYDTVSSVIEISKEEANNFLTWKMNKIFQYLGCKISVLGRRTVL